MVAVFAPAVAMPSSWGQAAMGQSTAPGISQERDRWADFRKACGDDDSRWTMLCRTQFESLRGGTSTNKDKTCEERRKDFYDLLKPDSDIMKTCKANGQGDLRKCLTQAKKCEECHGESEDNEGYGADCADLDDSMIDRSGSGFTGLGNGFIEATGAFDLKGRKAEQARIRRARNLFKACPIFAAAEIDDIRENIETFTEQKKSLEEKIQEKQKDLQESQNALIETRDTLFGRGQQCQAEGKSPTSPNYAEDCGGLDERMNAEVQQLTQEYRLKAVQGVEQIGDNLRNLAIQMKAAEAEIFDQETKIRGACHARALQAVENERKRREGLRQKGLLSQNSFVGTSGLRSLNGRLQQMAQTTFDQCMNDGQTQRQVAGQRESLRLRLEQLRLQQDQLLRLQEQTVNAAMNDDQNPELQGKLQKLRTGYAREKRELQNKFRDAQQKVLILTQELQKLNAEKITAQSALDTYKAEREAAGKAAKRSKGKSADIEPATLNGLLSRVQTAYNEALSNCGCSPAAPTTTSPDSPVCASIRTKDPDKAPPGEDKTSAKGTGTGDAERRQRP